MQSVTAPTPLERALEFTPDELDANRQGRLSPRQEREVAAVLGTMRRRTRLWQGFGIVWTVGFAVWALIRTSPHLLPSEVGTRAVLMGLVVVLLARGMIEMWRRSTDLRERRISVAEGVAETYSTMADGELIVGDLHAIVTHRQLKGFEAERSYRVYHVSAGGQSHILLSAEEL